MDDADVEVMILGECSNSGPVMFDSNEPIPPRVDLLVDGVIHSLKLVDMGDYYFYIPKDSKNDVNYIIGELLE